MKKWMRIAAPVVLVLITATATGCAPAEKMSLEDSCREYIALDVYGSDLDRVSRDIRAASPNWHTAVSEPAIAYQDILDGVQANPQTGEDEIAANFDAGQEASGRLADLCGTEYAPKY